MIKRAAKWVQKLSGINRGRLYDAQKSQMVKLETAASLDLEKIELQVKSMIQGEPVYFQHFYMAFAKQIYKLKNKYQNQALINELIILEEIWRSRGLDPDKLDKIKMFYVPSYTPPPVPLIPYIWVVDRIDKEVYKYTMEGVYVDSFDTTGYGAWNLGITTDGVNIYIVDIGNKEVYKYTMEGVYVSSFDTSAHGTTNYGIATDGVNIYIVDQADKEVYKYTMEGVYVSSFDTSAHGNINYGIATDGVNIWIIDHTDKEVYKYKMDGTYVSSFDTSAHATDNVGITTDGVNIWVVDVTDKKVYKYTIAGVYVGFFDVSAHGATNMGITTNNRYI